MIDLVVVRELLAKTLTVDDQKRQLWSDNGLHESLEGERQNPPPPSSLHGRTLLLGALCSRLLLPAAADLSVIHFLHHKQSFSSELEFLAQHLPGYYLKTKLI